MHLIYDTQTGKIAMLVDSTILKTAEDNRGLNQKVLSVSEFIDISNYYILNSKPTPRPDLDLPTTKQLTINEEWVVATLPEGTVVYIDGILVGEADETELVLSFPLKQTYSVKLDPPFPYKPHEMEVVVNEANT